jgi:hypothetical protein
MVVPNSYSPLDVETTKLNDFLSLYNIKLYKCPENIMCILECIYLRRPN